MKNWSLKRRWISVALVLIASFVVVLSSSGTQVARADRGQSAHNFDITFTKWVTCYSVPNNCQASDGTMVDGTMAGIITGGAAGAGSFSGEILHVIKSTPKLWEAKVLYQIHGTAHQFSARLHVIENDVTNKATLEGVITDGWLKGSPVHGSYNIVPSCKENTNPFPDPCYLVTLHIHVGD